MVTKNNTFGALFKKYRLKAEFETLSEFGDALAEEGFIYEDSIFSHWQRGDRIPKDRKVLLKLIKFFIQKGSITQIEEANLFLESANQGYMTIEEEKTMNQFLSIYKSKLQSQDFFNKDNENIIDKNLQQMNIFDYLDEKINNVYEKIYEGFPYESYNYTSWLFNQMKDLKLRKIKENQYLLGRLIWIRLRCLSDITKVNNFHIAYNQAVNMYNFAKEKELFEIGPILWMVSALKRLEILNKLKKKQATNKEAEECFEVAKTALAKTPKNHYSERLVEHQELAKIALIIGDQKYFDKQIEEAFACVAKITDKKQYLEAMVWDIIARGKLSFQHNPYYALNNIQIAKQKLNKKYRAVNLFLSNTEYQILIDTKDLVYLLKAKQLKEELNKEANLLDNPYQKARLKHKRLVGF